MSVVTNNAPKNAVMIVSDQWWHPFQHKKCPKMWFLQMKYYIFQK